MSNGRVGDEYFCISGLKNPMIVNATTNTPIVKTTINEDFSISIKATVNNTINNIESPLYRWYHRKTEATSVYKPTFLTNTSVLLIRDAKAKDSGFYFCVISVKESIVKTANIQITVNCK